MNESDAPQPSRFRSKMPWLLLAGGALIADLWTKHLAFAGPTGPDRLVTELFTGFRIIQVYNRGITFGLLEGSGVWLLGLLTSGVILALTWKLWTLPRTERLQSFALAIVIGGAIGNLYDRVLRTPPSDAQRGVRDFLDWYVPDDTAFGQWLEANLGSNHWYTSNVADVLIVCGVILLAWKILTEGAEADEPAEDDKSAEKDQGPATSQEGTATT